MGSHVAGSTDQPNALETQLRYSRALAECSQSLLTAAVTPGDKQAILNRALRHLLEGAQVSRVGLFENYQHPHHGFCSRLIAEATARGVPLTLHRPDMQIIPWPDSGPTLRHQLEAGELVQGLMLDIGQPDMLVNNDVVSYQFFPIHFGSRWWGYIGFGDSRGERVWQQSETLLLRTAAEMIGNVLQRWEMDETLARRIGELDVINRIGQILANTTDLTVSLPNVAEAVASIFDGAATYIAAYDGRRHDRVTIARAGGADGEPPTMAERFRVSRARGVS